MSKEKVLGFAAGLGCGVGIALLWAPKSGSETRSQIANQAREQADHIKQQATELRDSAAGILQRGQQEVQRHKEGLKRAVEAGVEAYQQPAA
jgi:gas vesicle protein